MRNIKKVTIAKLSHREELAVYTSDNDYIPRGVVEVRVYPEGETQ